MIADRSSPLASAADPEAVVIGTVFIDYKTFLGGTDDAVLVEHGGIGRNIAENLAWFGVDTAFITLLDDTSPVRSEIVRQLEDAGVATSARLVPGGIGGFHAKLDMRGEVVSAAREPVAVEFLDGDFVLGHERWFQAARVIVLELGLDDAMLRAVVTTARRTHALLLGVPTRVAQGVATQRELMRLLDYFVANRTEAEHFLQSELSSQRDVEQAVKGLNEEGIGAAISLGADGVVAGGFGSDVATVPALEAAVRDTTGAGDAFVAGMVAALVRGRHDHAIFFGLAAARQAVESIHTVVPRSRSPSE